MECKIGYSAKNNYTEVAFKLIDGITQNFDYSTWIRKNYPADADDILNAISKLLATNDANYIVNVLQGTVQAAEGEFSPQWHASSEQNEDPLVMSVENRPLSESKTDGRGIKGGFLAESRMQHPQAAYSKMIDDFKKRIIESVFYDPEKRTLRQPEFIRGADSLNLLNQVLLDYKIELMNKIYEQLYGKVNHFSTFSTKQEEEFTNAVHKLLNDYAVKRSTLDKGHSVFADYMILKNFDSLIASEFKTIIKVKPKFEGSERISPNMYDYMGSRVEYDDTYGEEYASASDYSSPLVKALLNYFHGREIVWEVRDGEKVRVERDTDRSIGFETFSNLITRVKEWGETSPGARDIIHGDVNTNWVKLINNFIDANSHELTIDELNALRGMKHYLFADDKTTDGKISPNVNQLKRMFVSQAKKTVRYRYLIVSPKYNARTHRVEMVTTELSDRLVDQQNFRFQGNMKNAVLRFRRDPNQLKTVCDNLGIEIESDGTITLKDITTNHQDLVINVTEGTRGLEVNFDSITANKWNDAKILKIIQSVLGVPLPGDVNSYISTMPNVNNLLGVFAEPLAITLYAASKETTPVEQNDYKVPVRFEDGILVTYPFVTMCDTAARLLSKIYGTTDTNVVRNEQGNALPSYQITSSVFEVKEFIWEINKGQINLRDGLHQGKRRAFVYKNNIHARNNGMSIGQIYTRGDIRRDNLTKSSNQLSAKEVYRSEVVENFLKRVLAKKSIILQPIVFSDKKTHFLVEYNTDSIRITVGNDEKGRPIQLDLQSILTNLVSTDEAERMIAQAQMLREIKSVRGDRTREQLIDVLTRYEKALGLSREAQWTLMSRDINNSALETNVEYLRNRLHSIRSLDVLRGAFEDTDLNENLDFSKYELNGETHFDLNLTLLHEAEMYLFNPASFDRYWNEQKRQLAKSLKKAKFKFDFFHDPSLTELVGSWRDLGEQWFDRNGKTMSPFIAKKNGQITTDLDSADDIELHPIIEAYMLSDGLLSEQFNELLFGTTNGFSDKYKGTSLEEEELRHAQALKEIENDVNLKDPSKQNLKQLKIQQEETKHIKAKDLIFIQSTAAKLGDQFKRTVLAGAIRTPYTPGLKYGISSEGLVSVVDDVKGYSYNYLGENAGNDANDGSGNASAYTCIQENESLGDAAVGNIKKTFLNYTDPATGTLYEIKWAEFPIFNDYRRGSAENERKYQKMHRAKEILVSDMQGFDISKFYNLNDVYYDDDDPHRRITHNETLFRKDGITGRHYRINSVKSVIENGKWVVYVNESYVDKQGNVIVEKLDDDRRVVINHVADLDAVFGGKNCEQFDSKAKKLVWSDAQNYIVNNIICNHNLKKHYIAFVVNKSAMKVGATNVNDRNIFGNAFKDKALKYFEMSFRHAGVQMNADHEIEESLVSEMSQMISALIQGGFSKATVNRVYNLIGRIAAENLKKFTTILDSPESPTFNDDLYIKIGKLFASSFVDGDKDDIGLAEAFVINAAKALKYNNTENKIPFSSNQIKGIFQATMSSTLNKLGIRRKFPGFGGINSPSYENMQLYDLGNGSYGFFDEKQDAIREELNQLRNKIQTSSYWNAENVFDEQRSPGSSKIDNPFIVRLNIKDSVFNDYSSKIGIEDSVVIRKVGDTGDGIVIRIRDIKTLDYVKYLFSTNDYEIYRWTIKPRELRQSQDTVKTIVNGKEVTVNWTDLDWVRAGYYLSDSKLLTPDQKHLENSEWNGIFAPEQLETARLYETVQRNLVIAKALRGSKIDWLTGTASDETLNALNNTRVEMIQPDGEKKYETWDQLLKRQATSNVSEEEKLAERRTFLIKSELPLRWVQAKVQEFALNLSKNGRVIMQAPISLGLGDAEIEFSGYQKASGQVIMGRANSKALDLRKGDTIAEIRSLKSDFFLRRLDEKYQLPLKSEIDGRKYDAILYDADGNKTLVILGNVKSNINRLEGYNPNRNYVVNSNFMYEKDEQEMFSSSGKAFYIDDAGNTAIVIEDEAALREILDSKYYAYVRYNYNSSNWKTLLRFLYPNSFDDNGTAISNITIAGQTFTTAEINELENLSAELKLQEETQNTNRLKALARKRYQAFEAQLNYILTRIPAQSMQSFMDVRVETWVDSIMNEVYVPRALTWIQGSDYDIDKDYMMGFGLLPDGTLATLSDLDKNPKFDSYEVLLLSAPEGRTFKYRQATRDEMKDALDNDTVQQILRGKVSLLNKVLTQKTSTILFASDVSDDDRKEIKNLVDTHEKSKRVGRAQMLGLQNTVVRGILEILRSPASQINMGKPISMDHIRAISKKSDLAKDEKVMTLDNSFTKFMMQEQNMVGREVIGIGAVSLKHFFAASTFMNQQITRMETQAKNGSVAEIIPLLMDIIYNSKIGNNEILTLANLDFSNLLKILKENPDRFRLVTIDEEKYKTPANDNLFKSEFVKDGNLRLIAFVEYLNSKSNGTWDSPVDAAFALSELISAATDNAKELILSKINATTKFADVYTYLLSTGKSFNEISDIMMSPIFNIVAFYAQNDLYDSLTGNADLENALQFVLNRKTLKGIDNKKFLWLLTSPMYESNDSFVPWVVRMMFNYQNGVVDLTDDLADNFVRRWYMQDVQNNPKKNQLATGREILEYVQDVYTHGWNDEAFDYTQEYKSFIKACYDELASNPESRQKLIDLLGEKMSEDSIQLVGDPDSISFDFLDYDNAAEFDEEYYADDSISDGLEYFDFSDITPHNAIVFYKYLTEYLLPKEEELRALHAGSGPKQQEISNIEDLLTKVLPAMKEQQINGQILGINQGLKTDDYGEQNWVRKLENFVNQRYIQSNLRVDQKDQKDFEFNLIRFLSDKNYRAKQIEFYEKVKSSINILKNITSVDHFWQMLQTVKVNRAIIERSAAIRIERDLVDKVLRAAKKKPKGISSGYFFKFNTKEFRELQKVVSDSLVLSWVASLKDISIRVPNGYSYFTSSESAKVDGRGVQYKEISIARPGDNKAKDGKLSPMDFIASFKRLMDEYIIPTLVAKNPNNEFLRSLTTGFRKDALTGQPLTFWKPAINLSDTVKSPKLTALYEPIAQAFNEIVDKNVSELGVHVGDWTIGDLFYLYNVIVHRDSIGGDSFTKLFEELTVANNRHSLVYGYNHFLGELDNGEFRWTESSQKDDIVSYGDYVKIDLRDVRYRCTIADSSEGKFRMRRTKSKDGKTITEVKPLNESKRPEGLALDLKGGRPKSYYIIDLPYINNHNISLWNKSIKIEDVENVELWSKIIKIQDVEHLVFQGNAREVLTAIVDVVRDIVGPALPIEIINNDILDDIKNKKIKSDLIVEDRMKTNPAFLYNGKIYINSDVIDLESPVHELMHVVCAVLKYGDRVQKSLYYKLLDSITPDSEAWIKRFGGQKEWQAFLDLYTQEYSDVVTLSDLKEELLVKALSTAFSKNFEEEWANYTGVTTSNLNRIVRSIMEDIFKIEKTGEIPIEDILSAPLGQILGIFRSQFNKSNVYSLASSVIPSNQMIARLKKEWLDKTLTVEGDC